MTQKYISNLFGKAHFKVAALLLLRALGAVLGTGLHTALHALSVQSAADDVVTHTREVLHTAAADHDHRVLLQGMTDAGDVSGDLIAIGEADTGDLTKSRSSASSGSQYELRCKRHASGERRGRSPCSSAC